MKIDCDDDLRMKITRDATHNKQVVWKRVQNGEALVLDVLGNSLDVLKERDEEGHVPVEEKLLQSMYLRLLQEVGKQPRGVAQHRQTRLLVNRLPPGPFYARQHGFSTSLPANHNTTSTQKEKSKSF
jgi:hypothetical protein